MFSERELKNTEELVRANEVLKQRVDSMQNELEKWETMKQELLQIESCISFVDKAKAFDEIMETFSNLMV